MIFLDWMVKMSKEKSIETDEITKRLNVIIYLLLKQSQEKGETKRQMIKELKDIGLKDKEIAEIFGRSQSYISSELTKLKKSKGKTKKGEKNG